MASVWGIILVRAILPIEAIYRIGIEANLSTKYYKKGILPYYRYLPYQG
jgi:hypothetical protein